MSLSKDVFPGGPGVPPPPNTDEGRAQVAAFNEGIKVVTKVYSDYADTVFKPLGATSELGDYIEIIMFPGEGTTFQYSPSIDNPRSELSPKIHFLGLMPIKGVPVSFVAPSWLEELQAMAKLPEDSPDKKRVIFVNQGTVATDMEDLLLPALRTFGGRSDLCVVATLSVRGRTLPDVFEVPTIATVVDYLLYYAILPCADFFLTNAGFGGFSHGIMNGVPMVMSGITEDKPEVSARAEWSGLGVNLRAQRPTPEALVQGVNKVLSDPNYKRCVMEVKVENKAMDPLGELEKIICSLVE
ncbi:hypothetical protein BX600DRAFT_507501 [Xylariales sp. PMI_506]|nr:hypothetical protein BX600DRAFT_507501 [Xylariales sp. PMI_506]